MSSAFMPSSTEIAELEQIRFAVSLTLDKEMLRGATHAVEWLRDEMAQRYILDIRSRFWGQKRDIELDPTPATWWDHFKLQAIPTFVRLLPWCFKPPLMKVQVLKAATVFPDVPAIQGGRYYYREFSPVKFMRENANGEGVTAEASE